MAISEEMKKFNRFLILNRKTLQAASYVITAFPANCVSELKWTFSIPGHLFSESNIAAADARYTYRI